MGRGRKRRNPRGKGYGLRSYEVPPASEVTVRQPDGQIARTEPSARAVPSGQWGAAAKKAGRQLQKNRDRINRTSRGTPSGSWKSKGKTKPIRAKYRQPCAACDVDIFPGMLIKKRTKGWVHDDCTLVWDKRAPRPAASSARQPRRESARERAAGHGPSQETRDWGEAEFAAYLDAHDHLPRVLV